MVDRRTKKELDMINKKVMVGSERPPSGTPKKCGNCIHGVGSDYCPDWKEDFIHGPPCPSWRYMGHSVPSKRGRRKLAKQMLEQMRKRRYSGARHAVEGSPNYRCLDCGAHFSKEEMEESLDERGLTRKVRCPNCTSRKVEKIRPERVRKVKAR